jgi:DNA repair photolyase
LTRRCLKELFAKQFPVNIQTKSKLVLRDVDLLKDFKNIEVGFTITTNEEKIARYFEPGAASVAEKVKALEQLHTSGIRTFAFIGPLLPGDPEKLVADLHGLVDRVFIDRMNYLNQVKALYRQINLEWATEDEFFQQVRARLVSGLKKRGLGSRRCSKQR